MKNLILAVLSLVALSACAPTRPLVDPSRTDMNAYERDLLACQQLSGEVPGVGTGAAGGAAVGYLLGTVLCRTMGGGSACSSFARGTAVAGAASGAASGAREESYTVKQCLRGRGYNPLN